ncbi:MAG: methyltransferase domain-containing protein [Bacteroidales bacterium]|nr:methyltransferase domain-containing protein [Bacteroidales bacterium]
MHQRQPLLSEISRRCKLKLLLNHIESNSTILEVGSGDGWFSKQLRKCNHKVCTLDLTEPTDILGDIRNWRLLGIKENSYDVVCALEVIEHVDCLGDLCSICKPNGLILLSSPHPNWDWLLKIFEYFHLTQKRTSKHKNLTDFRKIKLLVVSLKRQLFIHQVGLFRNKKQWNTSTPSCLDQNH